MIFVYFWIIMAYDNNPHDFGKNNIVLDEYKFKELEEQKMKMIKVSFSYLQGLVWQAFRLECDI